MLPTRHDLTGKVVLITGTVQGIGLGAARAMHARGASVALIDLDRATTESAAASLGELIRDADVEGRRRQ